MMMRVQNANTVRAASKTGAAPIIAPRRAIVARASNETKNVVSASESIKESARSGLAAVSAFALGVSLLISPVEPAQAVLPPDNGAGLIKSGANALPQPLNKLKDSAAAYKDSSTEASSNKAADKIKGGLQDIKEKVTGAAEDVKSNASDAASDIKSSANKLGNKVAFLGVGESASDKVDTGSQGAAKSASNANAENAIPGNAFLQGSAGNANNRLADKVQGDVEATKNTLRSVKNDGGDQIQDGAKDAAKSVNAFLKNKTEDASDKLPSADSALTNVKNAVSDVKDSISAPSLPSLPSLPNPISGIKNALTDTKDGIVESAAILKNANDQPQRDIDFKPRESLVETAKAGKEAVVSSRS